MNKVTAGANRAAADVADVALGEPALAPASIAARAGLPLSPRSRSSCCSSSGPPQLVLGYGLIIDGLADQFQPSPQDLATSIYISATTLVPLSYGDFVPEGGLARAVIIAESATGVGIAALVITLLFSLYESFRDREEKVISLDALAGAPPSGVQILENAAKHSMRPELIADVR